MIHKLLRAKEAPVIALFVALFIFFALKSPTFMQVDGLLDCLRRYSCYAMLAVGLTLIIGNGGIDISVGSVLGLSSVVLGVLLSKSGASVGVACLVAIATGLGFGLLNGLAISYMRLQPVVVTLSTMAGARGLAYVIAGQGISSINLPPRADGLVDLAYVSPAPMLIALAVAIAGWFALSRCTYGRGLLAMGSSEKAAWLSGIDVNRVRLAAYAVTGALAGLAGVMTTGMMSTATTDAGWGYEFEAITAVLMGGTSILGGEATVAGSIFGVLTAATISHGFGQLGISDHWRMLCLGLILIVSVLLDRLRKYIARKSAF